LNVDFGGCGAVYTNWFNALSAGSESWKVGGAIFQDYGFGAAGYANDQIVLSPSRRDDCWDMGSKADFTRGWNNDANYLNKDGKQTQAIMRMIERLMQPKDSQYDL
jgi:hypothetical protein